MSRYEDELRIVRQLSLVMLEKLEANRHKDMWSGETYANLVELLQAEVIELDQALAHFIDPMSKRGVTAEDVIRECADVANFAAMIVDVIKERGAKQP